MTAAQTPKNIRRYEPDGYDCVMMASVDGNYVEFDDYEQVKRELADVRRQLEESAKTGLKYMAQAAEETRKAELAESELAAAKAEADALREDAERYRWWAKYAAGEFLYEESNLNEY